MPNKPLSIIRLTDLTTSTPTVDLTFNPDNSVIFVGDQRQSREMSQRFKDMYARLKLDVPQKANWRVTPIMHWIHEDEPYCGIDKEAAQQVHMATEDLNTVTCPCCRAKFMDNLYGLHSQPNWGFFMEIRMKELGAYYSHPITPEQLLSSTYKDEDDE